MVREGELKRSPGVKAWEKQSDGIRLFMEGFRVLPYGEPANDWLSLDADYMRRDRSLDWLDADAGTRANLKEG